MTVEVLDYDPATGVSSFYEWQYKRNKFVSGTAQDGRVVQACIDLASELRKDEDIKRKGIKKSWMHAAIVPIGVQEQLISKYRVNLHTNPKAAIKIIQRDYPHLMTATGKYA
jgi:hypothetical protein